MPVGTALTLTNSVLQALLEAGFDADAAGRALSLVTGTVWEGAKEALLTEKFGEHPTQTFLKRPSASCLTTPYQRCGES